MSAINDVIFVALLIEWNDELQFLSSKYSHKYSKKETISRFLVENLSFIQKYLRLFILLKRGNLEHFSSFNQMVPFF